MINENQLKISHQKNKEEIKYILIDLYTNKASYKMPQDIFYSKQHNLTSRGIPLQFSTYVNGLTANTII